MDKKNLKFLKTLNDKLGRSSKSWDNKFCREIEIYEYTHYKMKRGEIQKTLDIICNNDLIMYPINTNWGFSIGYLIGSIENDAPGIKPEINTLLQFIEKQLPKGYNFEKLSETFKRPRNLELVAYSGLDPIGNKSDY